MTTRYQKSLQFKLSILQFLIVSLVNVRPNIDSQFLRGLDLRACGGVERNEMRHFHFRFSDGDGFLEKLRGAIQSAVLHLDVGRWMSELALCIAS